MTVLGKNVLPEAKLGTLPFWRQYLRGFSQCAFQANEITGLLFVIGVLTFSWRMAVFYVLSVFIATVVARLALGRLFQIVARSPELVVSLALAWCFGVGLFGANLGRLAHAVGIHAEVSVSLEMGALIAGATIATSPFAYEVVSRVIHLRDFFVTLFFVGLGMSIPVPDGGAVVALAVAVAAVAVAVRFLVFLPLLYATGLDRRNAVGTSARLAQVSEFCLVIAYLGARLGLEALGAEVEGVRARRQVHVAGRGARGRGDPLHRRVVPPSGRDRGGRWRHARRPRSRRRRLGRDPHRRHALRDRARRLPRRSRGQDAADARRQGERRRRGQRRGDRAHAL